MTAPALRHAAPLTGTSSPAPIDPAAARAAWARAWERGYVGPPTDTGCAPWLRYRDADGYGRLWVAGRHRKAHRVSWVAAHGIDVPTGLVIDHACRNPWCVAADHLDPVSARMNLARSRNAGASAAGTGVCSRGHVTAGANARKRPDGIGCRACAKAAAALSSAARLGRPFPDPERARAVLADAFATAYALGLPGLGAFGAYVTRPDDLPAIAAWLADQRAVAS